LFFFGVRLRFTLVFFALVLFSFVFFAVLFFAFRFLPCDCPCNLFDPVAPEKPTTPAVKKILASIRMVAMAQSKHCDEKPDVVQEAATAVV